MNLIRTATKGDHIEKRKDNNMMLLSIFIILQNHAQRESTSTLELVTRVTLVKKTIIILRGIQLPVLSALQIEEYLLELGVKKATAYGVSRFDC